MKLQTKRLILREITIDDAKNLIKNINNLNISKWLLAVPYPYTMKDAKWWINHCKEKSKEKPRTSYEFAVELKSEPEVIGGFGITNIKIDQGTADLGYWLAEKHWRKGYAKEGVSKLIEYAFEKLKLRRLAIPAFATNPASNALAKSLGFIHEGTLRKAIVCKATSEVHDENVYGLLKEDWGKNG